MFSKILIANRGEIAVRVIQACQEMGIKTVAVFSEADRQALHVIRADEAVFIGAAPATESYLNMDRILAAARQSGAEAIHPGYGFLSENADFAQACADAGITFIGPSPESIRLMGNKIAAKSTMERAGVPVVPGYYGTDQSIEKFVAEADKIGYPVMVKAAAGGGGKGMRIVHDPAELADAVDGAKREALNAFGDDAIFLEKYIVNPRHIEFQIIADQHGNTFHLFERECSIQRRHQKVLEETPSTALTPEKRAEMGQIAIQAANAVNYYNAGTVEFVYGEDGSYYFLEMNTRLQVEHCVTEQTTRIDLVYLQILVADGQPLPFQQEQVIQRGHAIEVRIYAEDAENNFLPSTGVLHLFIPPEGIHIRNDIGIRAGMEVTPYYDPMMAKLTVYGMTREICIERLKWALDHYIISGVKHNIPFLRAVVDHPAFHSGETTTDFIARHFENWQAKPPELTDEVLITAVIGELYRDTSVVHSGDISEEGDVYSPWKAF